MSRTYHLIDPRPIRPTLAAQEREAALRVAADVERSQRASNRAAWEVWEGITRADWLRANGHRCLGTRRTA